MKMTGRIPWRMYLLFIFVRVCTGFAWGIEPEQHRLVATVDCKTPEGEDASFLVSFELADNLIFPELDYCKRLFASNKLWPSLLKLDGKELTDSDFAVPKEVSLDAKLLEKAPRLVGALPLKSISQKVLRFDVNTVGCSFPDQFTPPENSIEFEICVAPSGGYAIVVPIKGNNWVFNLRTFGGNTVSMSRPLAREFADTEKSSLKQELAKWLHCESSLPLTEDQSNSINIAAFRAKAIVVDRNRHKMFLLN